MEKSKVKAMATIIAFTHSHILPRIIDTDKTSPYVEVERHQVSRELVNEVRDAIQLLRG